MAKYSNVALKATFGETPLKYLGIINDGGKQQGYLAYSTEQVLNPTAKFALEYAHNGLVHIRSCCDNKYWSRSSEGENFIAANSIAKPVDDETQWCCTLFKLDIDVDNKATLYHVESKRSVCVLNDGSSFNMFLTIDPRATTQAKSDAINYDAFVILPKQIVLRANNDMFLTRNVPYNVFIPTFSSTNFGESGNVWEICVNRDGHFSIKKPNDVRGPYECLFRCPSNLSEEEFISSEYRDPDNLDQLFSAIMIDNPNFIALRCLGNKKICRKQDVGGVLTIKDCLGATADGIVDEAKFQVYEPVVRRKVTVFDFDIVNARVYNVRNLVPITHHFDNRSSKDALATMDLTITTTMTKSWGNSITVSAGVKTSLEAGIPFVADGKIEIHTDISFQLQWGETQTESQTVGDVYTFTVSPGKRGVGEGIAYSANCDVPFSYVQEDTLTNGDIISTTLYDGVFKGANAYGFYDNYYEEDIPSRELDA